MTAQQATREATPAPAPITVSVVIPVFNAAPFLPALFAALAAQTPRPPDEIVLVDSLSTDATRDLAAAQPGVRVVPIADFSHGRARNLGARAARGDVLVLMTQDALPADNRWLAELLAPFADPRVAGAYSRQIPRPDANPMEQFFLCDRFPPGAPVRRERRGDETLTLEQVFFSNVSAAIRRDLLLRYPFDEELIMSEDQQFSRDVMGAGYAVVYQPQSVVRHSHNYTLAACFRRYFDSVYSLTKIFPRHGLGTSTRMGRAYVGRELGFIWRRYPWWLPYYALYNLMKIGGTVLAHYADRMPRPLARRLSLHRYYWDRQPRKP